MAKIDDSVKKKVPELRFARFADDWEERKLSELIQKGGSGGTPKSTNKTYYDGDIPFLGISDISKSNGYIDDTEKHISEKGLNNSSAWIVPKGAISLAMYASVGKLAILNTDAATSQAFYNMVFEYESIRDYVYHRLGRANDLGEWTKLISTGTQANLNADKVKNFEIQVPQSIDEMKDISTFFNQLDIFITLQQRKLDLLKEQKKGYLQKMFPKNGAKVPELRFAGFTDAWEERKLSEIGKIVTGNTPNTSNKDYYNGDFLFVSPADIQENRYVNKTTTTLTELGFKTGRLVPKGATLFVSIGSTIGKTGQSICDVITNQQINSVISFSDYDDDFIYTSILNSSTKIKQLAATQAVPIINKNEFGKSIIKIPSLEEQQKIGAFFKQLDDIIALHQRKLDLLKEQKKGFLQKMFV